MLEYCVMQTTYFLNESSVYRRMNYFLVRLYEEQKKAISERGVQDKCQI